MHSPVLIARLEGRMRYLGTRARALDRSIEPPRTDRFKLVIVGAARRHLHPGVV